MTYPNGGVLLFDGPQTPESVRAVTLANARALGCTCEPDVTVRRLGASVWLPTVAHDDWCPLLQRFEGRGG